MRRIRHVSWGLESTNGAANIARLIAGEQCAAGDEVSLKRWLSRREIAACDEVWCHCGWYYGLWWAVAWARWYGKRICWVSECCYDPLRLAYHGWKKRLAGVFERWALRQCDEVVATCSAEAAWIRTYEPRVRSVTMTDVKRFFRFDRAGCAARLEAARKRGGRALHVLFLGREHPLKGVRYLRDAVRALPQVELREASHADEREKEDLWRWADVFALPTLSDNFGLVVAEALEQGVPVLTTDGAPAWLDLALPYGVCLKGYREASPTQRVALLKRALQVFAHSIG